MAARATAADFYREIRTVAATRKGGRDETTQQIRFMFRKRLRLRAKAVITRAVRTMTTRLRGGRGCVIVNLEANFMIMIRH